MAPASSASGSTLAGVYVVTAHQPNFLPGMSVVSKLRASDAVVWLDRVQYTKGGFTNRNRLPNGDWITVPVERHQSMTPIGDIEIGSPAKDWRDPLCRKIRQWWGGDTVDDVCAEIMRPYGLLLGLNVALLRATIPHIASSCRWAFQSHLDSGRPVMAVSDEAKELVPISDRLAMMVAELGGDVYLSGPSGRNYLDETPFQERGITVDYWEHRDANPCVLDVLARVEAAAA